MIDDESPRAAALRGLVQRAVPEAELIRGAAAEVRLGDVCLGIVGPGVGDALGVLDAIAVLHERQRDLPLVVVSERDCAAAAVAALRAGAADYLVFGAPPSQVADAIADLVSRRSRGTRMPDDGACGLVGDSRAIEQVRTLVRTAARTEAPVLIEGETGTGKEVVARALHRLGRRAAGPFVPINCAAVPETLAESEFFGHARGAFTGAVDARPGALQLADRGTLFLDEIEDLPLALQAKLLRVVQDREVRPLGASMVRRVDVRLIAASNRDLAQMVEAGGFRRDLYYRVRVLTIQLPPLRQRRDDLPLLIEHFVARFNRLHGSAFASPPPAALRPLLEHSWPGNVRELENTIESLLILAEAHGTTLGEAIARNATQSAGFWGDERTRILRVLEQNRWNRQRAAAALGISRVTLWRRMERHGIRDPLGQPEPETA